MLEKKDQKDNFKKYAGIIFLGIGLIIIVALMCALTIRRTRVEHTYNAGLEQMEYGHYEEAEFIFTQVQNAEEEYKDCSELIGYAQAKQLYQKYEKDTTQVTYLDDAIAELAFLNTSYYTGEKSTDMEDFLEQMEEEKFEIEDAKEQVKREEKRKVLSTELPYVGMSTTNIRDTILGPYTHYYYETNSYGSTIYYYVWETPEGNRVATVYERARSVSSVSFDYNYMNEDGTLKEGVTIVPSWDIKEKEDSGSTAGRSASNYDYDSDKSMNDDYYDNWEDEDEAEDYLYDYYGDSDEYWDEIE